MGSEVHQTGKNPMALPGIPVRKKTWRSMISMGPVFGGWTSPGKFPTEWKIIKFMFQNHQLVIYIYNNILYHLILKNDILKITSYIILY